MPTVYGAYRDLFKESVGEIGRALREVEERDEKEKRRERGEDEAGLKRERRHGGDAKEARWSGESCREGKAVRVLGL